MTPPHPTESVASETAFCEMPAASGNRRIFLNLLDEPEALEAYLADVRRRRDEHREQRRRAYWQSAITRLGEELEAARAEKDEVIAEELSEVLASFQEALSTAVPSAEPADPDEVHFPKAAEQDPETPTVLAADENSAQALAPPKHNGTHSNHASPAQFPTSIKHIPPPADEATKAELAAQCQDLRERIEAYLAVKGGELTHAFDARALFCEGQALALNPDTPSSGQQSLIDHLDDLASSKSEWGSGDPFCWRQQNFQIWNEQARLYQDCTEASRFLDWYLAHEMEVPENARIDILNAIAAAQQRLYRNPDGVAKRDDAVHELYRRVRATSQTTGFIRALNPSVYEAELLEWVASSKRLFQDVQAEVEENRARAEREVQKNEAIAAVVAWEEGLEGRTVTEDSIDADREILGSLLDACLIAGVSPTNIKVRTAILDTAPVLLEGLPKYAKFLEAVNTERAKRSLEAVEIAPPQEKVEDDDFSRMLRSLVSFTQKKTIVMLGGKSRPKVAEDLSELLQCNVAWHDSDSGDKFAKFSSKIRKADIVLLLKNFASHEIFYGSKDAMAVDGKHFVVLPSGYGVRQVVFQLSEYAAKNCAAKNSAGREKVAA